MSLQRFVKLDDIKDVVLKTADLSLQEAFDSTEAIPFEDGTWLDQKNILWDYHYDLLRTNQYSSLYPEEDRPKQLQIIVQRGEFFNFRPPTSFTWLDPNGDEQSGDYGGTGPGGIRRWFFSGSFDFIGILHGTTYGGEIGTVTGIHDGDGGYQYWTMEDSDGDPIGDSVDTRVYRAVFLTGHDGDGVPLTWGPPVEWHNNGVPAHTDEGPDEPHNVTEKIIVNFRSLCSDNVYGKLDDDLPIPPGFRPDDIRAQIVSAVRYKFSLPGYVAYIAEGLDTVFLTGEIIDSDYRLKEIPGGSPPPPPPVHVHSNPFGFAIDGHFMHLGSEYDTPTDTGYTYIRISPSDGS